MTNPTFWLGFFAGASFASIGYIAFMLYVAKVSGGSAAEGSGK